MEMLSVSKNYALVYGWKNQIRPKNKQDYNNANRFNYFKTKEIQRENK